MNITLNMAWTMEIDILIYVYFKSGIIGIRRHLVIKFFHEFFTSQTCILC